MRKKRIDKAITAVLSTIEASKLTREELLVVMGQVLIRIGYAIHFKWETTEKPPLQMTYEQAESMYFKQQTLGTALLKLGFDFQGQFLADFRKTLEQGDKKDGDY